MDGGLLIPWLSGLLGRTPELLMCVGAFTFVMLKRSTRPRAAGWACGAIVLLLITLLIQSGANLIPIVMVEKGVSRERMGAIISMTSLAVSALRALSIGLFSYAVFASSPRDSSFPG